MNRKKIIVFFLLLVLSATVEAGRIFGILEFNGKAVAKGTRVELVCSDKKYHTEVKNHGRYAVNIKKNGPCSLSVNGYDGTVNIISYSNSSRYNLLLKNNKNGTGYTIQRN